MHDRKEVRASILSQNPAPKLFSELEEIRGNPTAIKDLPGLDLSLNRATPEAKGLGEIPQTTYWKYREFRRTGERRSYESPYFEKRAKLSVSAMKYFIDGDEEMLQHVLDQAWSICEETNWVVPAHEHGTVDLFAAETAFILGELVNLLGDSLPWEVRKRIADEVDRRVFVRYFTEFNNHHWHKGDNNWCGVCNCSIGCAFLYLEKDAGRLADAVCQVLDGLEHFFAVAFEEDGGSTEGTAYWQYGLLNFIPFAELLRERTGGAVDILKHPRVKTVAGYPLNVVLSRGYYANFSDCDARVNLSPGVISRLAEKTDLPDLWKLVDWSGYREPRAWNWRLPIILRNALWRKDGTSEMPNLKDVFLKSTGVVRFGDGQSCVLAAKAGHNAECHNQNDVGTFIIHFDGETYICDPGRGLYSRDYFAAETRYLNVFNSSYGHSVPMVGGNTQKPDSREYRGEMLEVKTGDSARTARMEISKAYDLEQLISLVREIRYERAEDSTVISLEDMFEFKGEAMEIEEAFMTFLEVTTQGNEARISGEKGELLLTIEEPSGAAFSVESLEKECRENQREGVLKRISLKTKSPGTTIRTRVVMRFRAK